MSIDYESLIFYLKPRKKKNISSSTKKEYTLFWFPTTFFVEKDEMHVGDTINSECAIKNMVGEEIEMVCQSVSTVKLSSATKIGNVFQNR